MNKARSNPVNAVLMHGALISDSSIFHAQTP